MVTPAEGRMVKLLLVFILQIAAVTVQYRDGGLYELSAHPYPPTEVGGMSLLQLTPYSRFFSYSSSR